MTPALGRWARIVALCLLASACASSIEAAAPQAVVAGGRIEGVWTDAESKAAAFLGAPFAAPPVGDLRWRAPHAVEPWTGVRETKGFAPACMQGPHIVDWYRGVVEAFEGDPDVVNGPVAVSEDCLYLNVWTPRLDVAARLPVMVWIHGGSNKGGWSYEPNYVGERLAAEGVVVVSVAYRLGVFGFVSPPEAFDRGEANPGLRDQIAALEWIRDNITAFGGDPSQVTVFGESAGAAAVGALSVSPRARGLFRRAISQSGGFEFSRSADRAAQVALYAALKQALGGDPRAAAAEAVLEAVDALSADHDFAPVVDADTLTRTPAEALEAGEIRVEALMIGTNRDEWRMYIDPSAVEPELAVWRKRLGASRVDRLAMQAGALGALDRLVTAEEMRCPGYDFARAVEHGGGAAYVYRFDRVRPGAAAADFGAYHGAEIPYVFDTHDAWAPQGSVDRQVTDMMRRAWATFAKTGAPTLAEPAWRRFDAAASTFVFDAASRIEPALDDDVCAALAASTP